VALVDYRSASVAIRPPAASLLYIGGFDEGTVRKEISHGRAMTVKGSGHDVERLTSPGI
jgi:hypothetical protein